MSSLTHSLVSLGNGYARLSRRLSPGAKGGGVRTFRESGLEVTYVGSAPLEGGRGDVTGPRPSERKAWRQAPPTAGAVLGSLRAQRALSGRMQNEPLCIIAKDKQLGYRMHGVSHPMFVPLWRHLAVGQMHYLLGRDKPSTSNGTTLAMAASKVGHVHILDSHETQLSSHIGL